MEVRKKSDYLDSRQILSGKSDSHDWNWNKVHFSLTFSQNIFFIKCHFLTKCFVVSGWFSVILIKQRNCLDGTRQVFLLHTALQVTNILRWRDDQHYNGSHSDNCQYLDQNKAFLFTFCKMKREGSSKCCHLLEAPRAPVS